MIEEDKYLEIREKLRSLPKIKASDNFVQTLQHTITVLEAEKHRHLNKFDFSKVHFLRSLFSRQQNPWLIPAVGVTILAVFIFYILLNMNASENNNEDLSTNKIEQTQDNNAAEQNSMNSPSRIKENKTENEKSTGKDKDIASDLNEKPRNEFLVPAETEKSSSDGNNFTKRYEENESVQTIIPNDNAVLQNKPDLKKKSDLKLDTERMEMTTPQNKLTGPKKEEEKLKAVAVEDSGFPVPKSHLLDPINSLNRSSLEKLREKITNN